MSISSRPSLCGKRFRTADSHYCGQLCEHVLISRQIFVWQAGLNSWLYDLRCDLYQSPAEKGRVCLWMLVTKSVAWHVGSYGWFCDLQCSPYQSPAKKVVSCLKETFILNLLVSCFVKALTILWVNYNLFQKSQFYRPVYRLVQVCSFSPYTCVNLV